MQQQQSLEYWKGQVKLNPSLQKLTVPRLTKYIAQEPTEKQSAFLLVNCRDGLYGGEAGGGKSSYILMAALQWADIPGYNALIIRKTYQDLALPDAIMTRAIEWMSSHNEVHWNDKTKIFTFPSGATLTFGYLDSKNDHLRYQCAAFHFIGIDEATQIPMHQILYLFSRLRRPKNGAAGDVPLRFRLATNPGGLSHNEIKERYVDENISHYDESTGEDRIFIPAGLDDNPHLDTESYKQSLMQLPPLEREQLLHGDWNIRIEGRMFKRQWFEIVDVLPEGEFISVRYWDMAATEPHAKNKDPDYTVGLRMDYHIESGIFYITDIARCREEPAETERLMKVTAQMDGKDVAIWEEQEPGSSGKTVIHARTKVMAGYEYEGDKVTGSKINRARPVPSQAKAGNVKLLRANWNNSFLDEAELFPDGSHDDQVDAKSGAFEKITVQIENNEPIRMEWV